MNLDNPRESPMSRPRTSTHRFPALVALAAAGLAAQAAAPTGQIAGLAAQVAAPTGQMAGLGAQVAAPRAEDGDSIPGILWALRLPTLLTEARQAGVTEVVVREVLEEFRRRGLPADEAARVIREEVDAVHAGAPRNNFGGFVRLQLDAGLRGRALADAIRAEHRARGIGRPEGREPPGRGTKPKGGRP
jgi:hypothetical protein